MVEANALEHWWANLPAMVRWQRRVIAALFVALVGVTWYLGVRIDGNTADLADSQQADRVRAEKICDDLTANASRFNDLIDTLIKRTQANTTATDEQKAEAVRLYSAVKQTLPVCHPAAEKP